jgi:LysM repeat protein
MEVLMKRSRRSRTSRPLIVVLALGIVIISIALVIQNFRGTEASKDTGLATLSAVDTVPVTSTAQTQPSAATAVVEAEPTAPIQTNTPTHTNTPVPSANPAPAPAPVPPAVAALPTTRPAADVPPGATWSQLLNGGPANGATVLPVPKSGPIVTGNGPLADGKARMQAGQLLDARTVLNDALLAGTLTAADAAAARAMMSEINQTVIFSPRSFAADPFSGTYAVKQGDSLAKIAAAYNTTWELLGRINGIEPRRLRYGSVVKVVRGPFFAVVNKQAFTMDIYLGALPPDKGSMYVMTMSVGLGKDDSTPTGLWAVGHNAKLRHPTYYPPEGGQPIEADDPANPLGGYWVGLTGVDGQAVGRTSYGIHGTIDQSSIGHQASLGCIRLKAGDIPLVFDLMVEGKSMVLVRS